MKLYPEAERARRLKVIQDEVKKESWKIIGESLEFWCYEKSKEVIELHASGKHKEAQDLSALVWAARRVYSEPQIIIQETTKWLKTQEWMKKILPKQQPTPQGEGI